VIANSKRDLKGRRQSTRARLADEQAALRRVATLVAQDAAPAEIFAAISAEVDRVFGLDPATFDVAVVGRFEPGPELVVVGLSKSIEAVPFGSRWPPDDLFAPAHVLRTGRSARIGEGDLDSVGGEVADFLRRLGYLSQVASPIVVDGRLWGAMSVNARNDFPAGTEERLERFTELIATAIAHAESRGTLAQLANEQAALSRVATLVAKEDLPEKVFAKVAEETGRLLGGVECTLLRNEHDGAATNVGTWGEKISAVFPLKNAFLPRWRRRRGDRPPHWTSAADRRLLGRRRSDRAECARSGDRVVGRLSDRGGRRSLGCHRRGDNWS
jgi:hypothetical protein